MTIGASDPNAHVTLHYAVDVGFVTLGPTKVALLGVVQGVTELLPVSSSAHMRVVPAILGWQDPGAAFSAAMQLAALLAIVVYFRSEIAAITVGTAKAVQARRWRDPLLRLAVAVVIATIPIAVIGSSLSRLLNACHSPFRNPMLIGTACLAMAFIMGAVEMFAKHERQTDSLTLYDAAWIGIAQVGALIPGASRSGSTFGAALVLSFRRADAARVSFLLGVPAISLAGLHEIWLLSGVLDVRGWYVLGVGLAISSLCAFVAIWALMKYLERSSSWLLVGYRALFGLVLMIGAYLHLIT